MALPFDLVILDRDGVINKDLPTSVRTLKDFHFLEGALEAIVLLNRFHVPVVIVTNQAVVGRGELSSEGLLEIHDQMLAEIRNAGGEIEKIYVCTDTTVEPNNRRKPAPGMIFEALEEFNIQAKGAVFIGDALRDLEAAHGAECASILVRTGKGAATEKDLPPHLKPLGIYDDLRAAVGSIFP